MENETTYWNGEKTPCKRVTLVMEAQPQFSLYWGKHLVGTRVKAVEVNYETHMFYLYDDDGTGWIKVTQGHGSPSYGHCDVSPVPGTLEYINEL